MTDETNIERTKNIEFFAYGGIIINSEWLPTIDIKIDEIRKKAGFNNDEIFKFETRSRPRKVSISNFNQAKSEIINLCIEFNIKFITTIIHHEILKNQKFNEYVIKAADYVIGRFNYFLEYNNSYGICIFDNLPEKIKNRYLKTKFMKGLEFKNRNSIKMKNIKLYATTCIGASNIHSIVDIILGSFRYCINEYKNENVAIELMNKLIKIIWYKTENGKKVFENNGLIVRPQYNSIGLNLKCKYSDLIVKLNSLLNN